MSAAARAAERAVRLVRDAYAEQGSGGGEAAEDCRGLAAMLDEADIAWPEGEGAAVPACRHLATSYALAEKGPFAELARALREADPVLSWWRNANYMRKMPGGFLDNYGSCLFVGPQGPVRHDRLLIGLVLFGPHLDYPAHSHPARETYAVISGDAEWRRGEEGYRIRRAGEFLVHPERQSHAMRTAAEPLLALWAWTGDIETAADLDG